MSDLSKISIGIKTFLRDSMLFEAVKAIHETMPEVQMIVVDDGDTDQQKLDLYRNLRSEGHITLIEPFDSGFGYKSNMIADAFDLSGRDYLLIASDDFDFHPTAVRNGIEHMLYVLERNPHLDIVSGRVNNRSYEFHLVDEGHTITEIPVEVVSHSGVYPLFVECDLTVNYSLIRRRVLEKIRWDDDVKIGGGEHGAFFVDVKRAGFKVAFAPGVNINEQSNPQADPRYNTYRARAKSPARPCFDKRGIRKYVLGCGHVDYEWNGGPECRSCGGFADRVVVDNKRIEVFNRLKIGGIIDCDDPKSLRFYCKECLPCAS